MKTHMPESARVSFDKWQQPYTEVYGAFTVLSSGDAIVQSDPTKDHRGCYVSHNITLWSTNDDEMADLLRPDGTPVPKRHLTEGGGTTLLLDWCHGIAVNLGGPGRLSDAHPGIPERFDWVGAYLPGAKRVPLGRPIHLSVPHKLLPEERQALADLQSTIRARVAMTGVQLPQRWEVAQRHRERRRSQLITIPLASVGTLHPERQRWILDGDHYWARNTVTVPYLKLGRHQPEWLVPPEMHFNYCNTRKA